MDAEKVKTPRPLRSIRAYCLWCCGDSAVEVRLCLVDTCPLHGLRMGKRKCGPGTTALRCIRKKCLDCSGGSPKEVRGCGHGKCSLWPYRLGKNPNMQGLVNAGSFQKKKNHGEINDFGKRTGSGDQCIG